MATKKAQKFAALKRKGVPAKIATKITGHKPKPRK